MFPETVLNNDSDPVHVSKHGHLCLITLWPHPTLRASRKAVQERTHPIKCTRLLEMHLSKSPISPKLKDLLSIPLPKMLHADETLKFPQPRYLLDSGRDDSSPMNMSPRLVAIFISDFTECYDERLLRALVGTCRMQVSVYGLC